MRTSACRSKVGNTSALGSENLQLKEKKGFSYKVLLLITSFGMIIAANIFLGCASDSQRIYVKEGKQYGKVKGPFRHRWWNHYERGLSYADGEFYKEAEADLREALRQRDKDQRMARTYGMHFIDYFPHRELGIVYYQLGDLGPAKEELDLSLRQFPSAKARFYLDRVRKALIEQKALKISPPRLTLDFKTQVVWTRRDRQKSTPLYGGRGRYAPP